MDKGLNMGNNTKFSFNWSVTGEMLKDISLSVNKREMDKGKAFS